MTASAQSPTPTGTVHTFDVAVIGWGKGGKTLARAGRRVAAVERRDTLTGRMRQENYSMLADLDTVVVFDGTARFTGPKELEVTPPTGDGAGRESVALSAETILNNTESTANIPDLPGARVGGGYIGIEFASLSAQYGSLVTVLDRGPRRLLPARCIQRSE